MTQTHTKGSDNALEDYFLELLVEKHIIDREIDDLITVVEESKLHADYQILLKKILFGDKNLYIENWGTLEGSLEDIVKNVDIRGGNIDSHGIVLHIMLRVIETVFDVEDDLFSDFVICEQKEDIEHELIILMKRILDIIENALREMLANTDHLEDPIDDHIKEDFNIVNATLLQYPREIMESQGTAIEALKIQVDNIALHIEEHKKEFKRASR